MNARARVALFKSLGALTEALPLSFDTWIASRLARLIGRRTRVARHNLSDNLRRALTGADLSVEADLLDRFTERAFAGYGTYWAEGGKLPALDDATINEKFTIAEGLEHLVAAKERGTGVVVALPHVGSWEWGGAYLARLGMPMTAVAEELEPRELFDWFKHKRQVMGMRIEPLDERAGTALLAVLKAGEVVGLLCDRDIQGNGIEVEFFNERVRMPAGPATLALRTGAALVAAACYVGPGSDHFAVITPPIVAEREGRLRDDVTRVTQAIARELEGLIARAPEQWYVLQARFEIQ